ncbi:hypothetical protein ACS0TY_013951 [Phlomoides rotata]
MFSTAHARPTTTSATHDHRTTAAPGPAVGSFGVPLPPTRQLALRVTVFFPSVYFSPLATPPIISNNWMTSLRILKKKKGNLNSVTRSISEWVQNLDISNKNCDPSVQFCTSSLIRLGVSTIEGKMLKEEAEKEEEEELRKLLLPNVEGLPETPRSAIETNFTTYFAPDLMKPGHDQYVHRHANGLCVVGLAPHHLAFKDKGGIVSVDFNVGKSDRSGIKVTGKRKKVNFCFFFLFQFCKYFFSDIISCD